MFAGRARIIGKHLYNERVGSRLSEGLDTHFTCITHNGDKISSSLEHLDDVRKTFWSTVTLQEHSCTDNPV